jgi:lysophospholipase L1-like esterase
MQGTIICYGDSNTYGYDPRLGGGGRYPKEERWVDILSEKLGCRMENQGLCGRCIPSMNSQLRNIKNQVDEWRNTEPSAQIWVMLGTNDLLMGQSITASEVAGRMKYFLEALLRFDVSASDILLIAPPQMRRGTWVEDDALIDEALRLGSEYKSVSEALGIHFVDAGKWDLDLCFDGVHLSDAGHLKFAENMMVNLSMNRANQGHAIPVDVEMKGRNV